MILFSDLHRDRESRSSRCWAPIGVCMFELCQPFSPSAHQQCFVWPLSTVLKQSPFPYNDLIRYPAAPPQARDLEG